MRYALLLHSSAGTASEEERNNASEEFHLPFVAVRRKTAEPLRPEGSFMSVTPDSLVLSALKESEDGRALIVRLYNPGLSEVTGAVHSARNVAEASVCRLDETETGPAGIVNGKSIPVRVPPSGIVTLRIRAEEG